MKKYFLLTGIVLFIQLTVFSQKDSPRLLLRLDDNGMNHAVTKAIEQVAATGIPFSTSVMFACPWYQEAVAVLKKYPKISVGVHLTLNSEWKYFRWGPVLGQTAVSSLVDSNGYFHPSTTAFLQSNYKLEEVERELEAQIDRAIRSGLQIDYVDYHMGTATATPELRAIVEKLAKKYKLGISRYFGENYYTMFDTPVEQKKNDFLTRMQQLSTDKVNLFVMHVAEATPEMNALVDMNNTDQHSETKPLVALHRNAELKTLLSAEFQDMIKKGKLKLVTYRDLIRQDGPQNSRQ
ncbi:ChbG/HpnK family deacetylase [Terrimonas pollutisoli]|uniref:ChbG/HpnK family deacetylase n=1 Tax=Terrimonas pollutisoli TaxID=3034147 RepID=UPI0023EB1C68|nr:ChbG/HpnK family deacetylase [Terrimonas sp. H1YJ31]